MDLEISNRADFCRPGMSGSGILVCSGKLGEQEIDIIHMVWRKHGDQDIHSLDLSLKSPSNFWRFKLRVCDTLDDHTSSPDYKLISRLVAKDFFPHPGTDNERVVEAFKLGLAACARNIQAEKLLSMLTYSFDCGKRHGRQELQHQLGKLILGD